MNSFQPFLSISTPIVDQCSTSPTEMTRKFLANIEKLNFCPYYFDYVNDRYYVVNEHNQPKILDENIFYFIDGQFDKIHFKNDLEKQLFTKVAFKLLFVYQNFHDKSKCLSFLVQQEIKIFETDQEIKQLFYSLFNNKQLPKHETLFCFDLVELGFVTIDLNDVINLGNLGWSLYYISERKKINLPLEQTFSENTISHIKKTQTEALEKNNKDLNQYEKLSQAYSKDFDHSINDLYEQIYQSDTLNSKDYLTFITFKAIESNLDIFIKHCKKNQVIDIKSYFQETIETKGASEFLNFIENPSETIKDILNDYEHQLKNVNPSLSKILEEDEN